MQTVKCKDDFILNLIEFSETKRESETLTKPREGSERVREQGRPK